MTKDEEIERLKQENAILLDKLIDTQRELAKLREALTKQYRPRLDQGMVLADKVYEGDEE